MDATTPFLQDLATIARKLAACRNLSTDWFPAVRRSHRRRCFCKISYLSKLNFTFAWPWREPPSSSPLFNLAEQHDSMVRTRRWAIASFRPSCALSRSSPTPCSLFTTIASLQLQDIGLWLDHQVAKPFVVSHAETCRHERICSPHRGHH